MNWRVGRKVPINIYDGERPVCQCHCVEDALNIVKAMNRAECQDMQREVIGRLRTALEDIAGITATGYPTKTWIAAHAQEALDSLK